MAGCRADFITTHRLSTIKVAHRIAMLETGCIVELGTHTELMEKNELCVRLYSMQFPTRKKISPACWLAASPP